MGLLRWWKWSLFKPPPASNNAGVTVSIVGLTTNKAAVRRIFSVENEEETIVKEASYINAYLVAAPNVLVSATAKVPDERTPMQFGNHPYYANALMLEAAEAKSLIAQQPDSANFIRPLYGSRELINGLPRACIWITEMGLENAKKIPALAERIQEVQSARLEKKSDKQAQKLVQLPYRFRDQYEAKSTLLVVPIVSSENRPYLPVALVDRRAIVHNKAFAMYDAPLWNMAVIASRLHLIWISTVCVRMRTDFSYSNTLGWNTFPIPKLTEKNKQDLVGCAEDILLAREAHFPACIADLYDPNTMPDNLRNAHQRNDEVLERIYIGRRFKNDSERLEKLFELYTELNAKKKIQN